jgi:tetratricopeptide (TPR) repeat protein
VDRAEHVQAILAKAAELEAEQVAAFLDQECEGNAELRQEVESLLSSLRQATRFLTSPTRDLSSSATAPHDPSEAALREGPGTRIGRYKLLELIGEGGFGSVFMAEQEHPVKRKVALKIIKLGMDTRQVVARFEQERQALAMMEHPGIARVLDAGETETGRPFFVMELVKGDPIIAYCDNNHLSIPERLHLFTQVCEAVQHAHTKGVIHRDIKPSNILVNTQDGRPHAHIIDFGIAKATSAQLTERTLFTEHRQLIGTPAYMSPEQAEGSLDIDTRTDVYSLGVLLYELLTGATPFSRKELRSASYAEIQRIIRETEPLKPSTELTRSVDTIASVAAQRATQPARLSATVRGELDWVVMKALEKDRARRYDSPGSLAADVRRYLAGEAVVAAPAGRAYQVRKFVVRHKGVVTAAGAVGLALLIGIVAFAWQAKVAMRQRDAADHARAEAKQRADELQQVSEFQGRMLEQIDATTAGDQLWSDLRERLDKELEKAGVPAADRATRAQALTRGLSDINATDTAAAMLDRAILTPSVKEIDEKFKEQPTVDATLRYSVAMVYRTLGLYAKALPQAAASADAFERVKGTDNAGAIASRALQADLLFTSGRTDEAIPIARASLQSCVRLYGQDNRETLTSMSNLGNMLRSQRKFAEAELLLKGAVDGFRRTAGNSDRTTLIALNTYGYLMIAQGKLTDAEPFWREAYDTGRRVFGPDDADVLVWGANVAGLLLEMGKYEDAVAKYREAVEGFRKARGEEHPSTLDCLGGLSEALIRWGGGAGARTEEAAKHLGVLLSAQRRTFGPEHPDTLSTQAKIGKLLYDQGRFAESEATIRQALDASRRVQGSDSLGTLDMVGMLAQTLSDEKKHTEADALYQERINTLERTLGKEHFAYLNAAAAYANSAADQGGESRLAEAEQLLRQVVQTRRRVSGETHPETIYVKLVLGRVLKAQGRLEEADPLIAHAVEDCRTRYQGDHPRTAAALSILGDLRLKQGHPTEAEPALVEALEMRRRLFKPDHTIIRLSEASLAECRNAIKK